MPIADCFAATRMRFDDISNGGFRSRLKRAYQWSWKTYSDAMNYGGRITMEAGKRGGKPCIRGLRITVYEVLEYLASACPRKKF